MIDRNSTLGRWLPPVALLAVALLVALAPRSADAHATFDRSDPQPNSVLADSPTEIRIWFTEPLEFEESSVRLFDETGHELPGITVEKGEGEKSLVAPLMEPLANGTYSVVWKNISAADGHPLSGYFTFTVGTQADVASVTSPVIEDSGGAPIWLQALSRWLVLLALAVAIAVWPVWLLVLWPAVRGDADLTRELSARAGKLGVGAAMAALIANLLALAVQATYLEGGSFFSRIGDTVSDTRYGRLWLARVGLLVLMAVAFRFVPWLDPPKKRIAAAAALVIAALLPLPVSMNAHASALEQGRTTAIAFDYTHLLAASLWFGGLTLLTGVLLRTLRSQIDRRVVLAQALPRFSAMALVCWGLLAVTGLYAWWLHVGSWDALRETQYGQSLLIKLIVAAAVLLIATANLLLITRKLAQTDPQTSPKWFGRLGYGVLAELVLTTLVLLAVGRMTSLQPGRDVLAADNAGQTVHFDLQGRDATLKLDPGVAGTNHFLVTIPGDPVPDGSETLLRLTFTGEQIGTKELQLDRSTPTTFETHGSELGIAGDWEIELLVRKIGEFEWTDTQSISLDATGSAAPKPPWRFGAGGLVGLLLLGIAFTGFVVAWRAGKSRLRMESAGLGAVAALLGLLLMAQARIQPATGSDPALSNPVAATSDSISRGAALYQANCAACHGATGQGDGRAGVGLFPKPADFTAGHTKAHLDGQLFGWIQNGKAGTGMPAFGELTDEQIWDLINYIQVDFQDKLPAEATPSPSG
jgi:copper transport protein